MGSPKAVPERSSQAVLRVPVSDQIRQSILLRLRQTLGKDEAIARLQAMEELDRKIEEQLYLIGFCKRFDRPKPSCTAAPVQVEVH